MNIFRGGILKTANTNEVEIAWEPPKGDFTKYVLTVENLVPGPKGVPRAIIPRLLYRVYNIMLRACAPIFLSFVANS